MPRESRPRLIRASWLAPVSSPPLRDGALRVLGGRIAAVGTARDLLPRPGDEVVDFPGCVLAPGLVNAHTHLELSGLSGFAPAPFLEWVARDMIPARLRLGPADYAAAAREGARRLRADGVTAVGDFSTGDWAVEALAGAGLRGTVYWEVIGNDPALADGLCRTAEAWARRPAPEGIRRGIAPHAPYSVSWILLKGLGDAATAAAAPVAVHAGELAEEGDLLMRGEGPFAAFMRDRGIPWAPPPQGASPVPYLETLGVWGPGGLAVHANYLAEADVALLARRGVSVVFCPGSHAFFGHRDHPLPRLLAAGVNVGLGTDSTASNDGLSLRREMRRAAEAFPALAPADVLAMATLGGARALGIAHEAGSLEVGKAADLAVFRAAGPADLVREPPVVATLTGGEGLL